MLDSEALMRRIEFVQKKQNLGSSYPPGSTESTAMATELKLLLESLEIMLRIQRQQQTGEVDQGDWLP